jgi:hypothetical protein
MIFLNSSDIANRKSDEDSIFQIRKDWVSKQDEKENTVIFVAMKFIPEFHFRMHEKSKASFRVLVLYSL